MLDDAAQAFGATYKNRRLGTLGGRDRDQLLPGQAARRLWRRRRGLHRRRRACAGDAQPAHARRGREPIRLCAHRHERPARHHPGGGADREAEDLSRRDRGARARRAPLRRGPRRCRDRAARGRRAAPRCGRSTRSASPPAGATRWRPRSRRRAFRPRSITPSRCIGRTPIGTSRSPRAARRSADQLAGEVISLPMHAYLDEPTQDRIIAAVRRELTDSRSCRGDRRHPRHGRTCSGHPRLYSARDSTRRGCPAQGRA